MGQFRITITATGGHGCSRDKKDGDQVYGCRSMHCIDCRAREYVEWLQRLGCNIEQAELRHWPDTPAEVVDSLPTGKRKGSFSA